MILEACNSSSLAETLDLVEKILLLFEIIIPVILFIYITKNLIKISKNPEEKKNIKKINGVFILLVIVYLIPSIFMISMNFLKDKTNLSSCWNNIIEIDEPEPVKEEKAPEPEEEEEEVVEDKDKSYATLEGSNTLANSMADLAIKVAPVANPNTSIKADAWLGHGKDRETIDKRMHNYIKIVDATITNYLNDTTNPNYHIGYNNPAYCSSAGAVGAIIRATADPDFETFNNCAQLTYINNNPKKWIKVGQVKAGDNFDKYCKPGDLLISIEKDVDDNCINGHTFIYVGNELAKKRFSDTKGNVFQANYNSITGGAESTCPSIDYVVKDIKDYMIFRPLDNITSNYSKIDINKVLSEDIKTGSFW